MGCDESVPKETVGAVTRQDAMIRIWDLQQKKTIELPPSATLADLWAQTLPLRRGPIRIIVGEWNATLTDPMIPLGQLMADPPPRTSNSATAKPIAVRRSSKEKVECSYDVFNGYFVKTLTGTTLTITSPAPCIFVEDLKALVEDADGIPIDQQRLIYKGQQMDNGQRLDRFGCIGGSTVHLVLRLRGNGTVSVARHGDALCYDEIEVDMADPQIRSVTDSLGVIRVANIIHGDHDMPTTFTVLKLQRPVVGKCDVEFFNAQQMLFEGGELDLHRISCYGQNGTNVIQTVGRRWIEEVCTLMNIEQSTHHITSDEACTVMLWLLRIGLANMTKIHPDTASEWVECRRASGAWVALKTPEDLRHVANTGSLRLRSKYRVFYVGTQLQGDETTLWLEPNATLQDLRALITEKKLDLPDDLVLCVLRDGPENVGQPTQIRPLLTDADFNASVGDGTTLVALQKDRICTDHNPPLPTVSTVFTPRALPALSNREEALPFIYPYEDFVSVGEPHKHVALAKVFTDFGFLVVDLPEEMAAPLEESLRAVRCFFEDTAMRSTKQDVVCKRSIAMDPDDRTWGWHHMPEKAKEILKLRDVPSASSSSVSPWVEQCLHPFRTVADVLAVPLLRGLGVDVDAFYGTASIDREHQTRDVEKSDECACSFFEAFRYGSQYPNQPRCVDGAATVAEPCEAHCDAGAFTLTRASTRSRSEWKTNALSNYEAPTGLEIAIPKHLFPTDGVPLPADAPALIWCDIEGLLARKRNRVLIFAGNLFHYICPRVRIPEHRVRMPHGAAPRFSAIYEVLPHPAKPVPRASSASSSASAEATTKKGPEMTGKALFVKQSEGKDSVNWSM